MGESPVKNYWLDAGWGTWGFKATPVVGKYMAETIANEKVPEIIEPFPGHRGHRNHRRPSEEGASDPPLE